MEDLFGYRNSKKTKFNDYDAFVEKFKQKKTTDDCYTPAAVYDVVLRYVSDNCHIGNRKIVRPFYPGGDFEHEDYPDNCVVVDNPPFSILSRVIGFFQARHISYFLFAPHLTVFSKSGFEHTAIITDTTIEYENGAKIKTAFVSNLFGETGIILDPEFSQKLKDAQHKITPNRLVYRYPSNLLTVSVCAQMLASLEHRFLIDRNLLHQVSRLDDQVKFGKTIFGSGFLVPDAIVRKREEIARKREEERAFVFALSRREKDIIQTLNSKYNETGN